jgi:asparagine synthase (glutamine-hydrolysing)
MCGIAGFLSNIGHPLQATDTVDKMVSRLHHRGPDGSGVFRNDYGVLGHSRLSIIDVEHGQQPMISSCARYVLVFNGEIYNFIELRVSLIQAGVRFTTHSDTEVLLQLLIAEREGAIKKLNGMFAFCFLDTHTGDWIIARDHFGIKPVYLYQQGNDALFFASEIKAFGAIEGYQNQVNQKSLNHYFTFQFCLGDKTLFENVRKVEPGYYLKGNAANIIEQVQYWTPSYDVDHEHTEQYFIENLEYLLHDSLKLQVRSDVPLGAYLSGGLDSSSIASYAARVLKRGMPVFTGRFAEGPQYDESEYARAVSAHIGSKMYDIIPSAEDFVGLLPKIIYSLDEPVAGPGVFPQYMVSKAASEHVKVILGGQGGDEIFGGYARYLVAYLEQSLKSSIFGDTSEGVYAVPLNEISGNLKLLEKYKPMLSKFWSAGLFGDMSERYFALIDRSPDSHQILSSDMSRSFSREQCYEDFCGVFNSIESNSYINKMSHFDMKTLLPALLHVEDRVSMASSIESRVPLLDHRIADLVSTIPPAMKFKGGKTKALLNTVVRPHLPEKVFNRKDKMGFPVPLQEWMSGGIVRDFVLDTLLSKKSLERGMYKKEVLENISTMGGVGSRQLWGILSLELWHQSYIDQ